MADAIEAIGYANKMGADVISVSWGSSTNDPALQDVISQSNALVVCAAGNSGSDIDNTPFYPSSFDSPNVLSVAAPIRMTTWQHSQIMEVSQSTLGHRA